MLAANLMCLSECVGDSWSNRKEFEMQLSLDLGLNLNLFHLGVCPQIRSQASSTSPSYRALRTATQCLGHSGQKGSLCPLMLLCFFPSVWWPGDSELTLILYRTNYFTVSFDTVIYFIPLCRLIYF